MNLNNILNSLLVAAIIGTIGFQMSTNKNVAVIQTEITMVNKTLQDLKDAKKEAVTADQLENLIKPIADQVKKNSTLLEKRSDFIEETAKEQIRINVQMENFEKRLYKIEFKSK
ncbi:hypothetical protein [Aquimarina sp. AU119]|uniref:hypothetical protein n=1 Tax=Aquimarina sp. AU119 TaxID=2108528 RepID=UPI00135BA853|nr:hypothetical protein [Aquimarina sp. AU119]